MHPTGVYDQGEFPPELCAKPLALIGFSGLDTLNNAVHKSIWEMFNGSRRVERSPVLFKLISNSHEFPVVKPKRNSYEWYIPKGILKRNWMNKHLYEIPAVMTIFYELDWNDIHWSEKMIECASRVQSLRAALEGRSTRIVVVLIQDKPPLPAGEDVLATDRAVALCASCELNAKSLFVLPHGDHLQGYVVRLETAFYDLAETYYQLEIKNVKSHKEHLNKEAHAFLFVRHHFKIGFLSELRQDNQTSHKHYTHAYNNLLDIHFNDVNALEIRTVAGFINYKLCRLMFLQRLPREAISQFRIHTDRFKLRLGYPELTFEYFAWMAKQHSVFGDIFDEAVKLGLTAVQAQHPGVYYQQAAQYAILRKKSCQELCSKVTRYPTPDPLEGLKHLEFYGQRPWRQGKLNSEVLDPVSDNPGIIALQYLEKQVNHSSLIVSLFGSAISQYKTYKCLRMRRHLVVQMADEYYDSEDYGKALTLYTHMLWDYGSELWWTLITDLLQKALKCSYLIGSVQDYITISLQLLAGKTTINIQRKKIIYENLNRVLNRNIPGPEENIADKCLKMASEAWKKSLILRPLLLSIDMSNVISCIECKTRFMQQKYQADEEISVELFICNTAPYFIKFTRVAITVNTPECSAEFAVDGVQHDLGFESNQVKRFLIEFKPNPHDIGKQIQVGAVTLQLGNQEVFIVDMKFSGMGNDGLKSCLQLSHFRRGSRPIYDFDNLRPFTSVLITPRHPKLSLEFVHNDPALLEEWYEIAVVLRNEEQFPIGKLEITINLGEENAENAMEISSEDSESAEPFPLKKTIELLQPAEKIRWKFFVRNHNIGSKIIEVKITYLLQNGEDVVSMTEEILSINVVKPFDVSMKFVSNKAKPISKFYVDEVFGIIPKVSFHSPWPITIIDSFVEFFLPVEQCYTSKSHIANHTFKNNDVGTDQLLAKTTKSSEIPISIGKYVVKWMRENGRITVAETLITGLTVEWIPIYIENYFPAYGLERTPLLATYRIRNKSQQLVQLNLNLESSKSFTVAGYKQLQISILPNSVKILNYNLCPLMAGDAVLPKLIFTVPENSTEGPLLRQDQLDALVQRTVQRNLLIMPQMRGSAKLPDTLAYLQVK